MNRHTLRRSAVLAAALVVGSLAISATGPALLVDELRGPGGARLLALGIEARAFCVRVLAVVTDDVLALASQRGCGATCRELRA